MPEKFEFSSGKLPRLQRVTKNDRSMPGQFESFGFTEVRL